MKSLISLENVWKIYKMGEVDVPAVRGVSVKINKGDFVAITGASGSGKSTMLNMVGCLDVPTKGKIHLKGQDITKMSESALSVLRGKTIGFIFQQYNLIQSVDAFSNVILPLELQDVDDNVANARVKEVLKKVGLERYGHHLPTQLSGGQQQRVSIARCLAADPEIILADEPTGALDSETGKGIIDMLRELWCEGKTIIMVTHDLELAKFAHTTIELKDGKVIKVTKNKNVKQKVKK